MSPKAFLWKLGIFLSPILFLVGLYIVMDPYKVIFSHTDYNQYNWGGVNRDLVSTNTYLANREQHKYNAFVFGNSRTLALHASDWKKLNGGIRPYHFDASMETLRGIWNKVKFIHSLGDSMKEVIMFLDHTNINKTAPSTDPATIHHPAVSDESWIKYHGTFLDAYFKTYMFLKYTNYRITGVWSKFDSTAKEMSNGIYFTSVDNDMLLRNYDDFIRNDSLGFYKFQHKLFSNPTPRVHKSVLKEQYKDARNMLSEMAQIFRQHRTRLYIVIPPLYDQVRLNPADISYLEELFGKGTVHDFSGTNEYTTNRSNYYEASHFRPSLGRIVLRKILGHEEGPNLADN